MVESKIQAHVDADLSRTQVDELAISLANKRRELDDRVKHLEQQMLTKDDCSHADAADAASAQEHRLRAQGMLDQHRQTITNIDAALKRLETGRYGISEKTGEPIAFGRLKLVPWARTCAGETESDI